MGDTILEYVKTKVDVAFGSDDTTFDERLLSDIDDAISVLSQLIYVPNSFNGCTTITEFSDIVEDSEDNALILLVKRYIGVSVRLTFDPPTGSVLTEMIKIKDNLESRLTIHTKEYNNGRHHRTLWNQGYEMGDTTFEESHNKTIGSSSV